MITRIHRLVSAHADHASSDRLLSTFELPEGRRIHAYAHRAGHHHLVTDGRARHELSLRVDGPSLATGVLVLRHLLLALDDRALAPLHTVVLPPLGATTLGTTTLDGVLLVTDPELGSSVLQAVGLSASELQRAALSSSEPLRAALASRDPLLVTRARDDAPLEVSMGEPSESEGREVPTLEVDEAGTRIDIGPTRLRATLGAHLRARLGHGRAMRLGGPRWVVHLERAEVSGVERRQSTLRVGVDASAIEQLALDGGVGPLTVGPVTLHFRDEPSIELGPAPSPRPEETEALRPFEARRLADEAAAAQRLEDALALIPIAVRDGAHGLLAELLHIDVLRRLGRAAEARAQLWRTADAWLGGERDQVWNTQWRRLLELAKKLKLDLADPRLVRARELAR